MTEPFESQEPNSSLPKTYRTPSVWTSSVSPPQRLPSVKVERFPNLKKYVLLVLACSFLMFLKYRSDKKTVEKLKPEVSVVVEPNWTTPQYEAFLRDKQVHNINANPFPKATWADSQRQILKFKDSSKTKILTPQDSAFAAENKPSKPTEIVDSLGNTNVVIVGSFEDINNANVLLKRLKAIGYDRAEIVMKDKSPNAIVISGFYLYKNSAKLEVAALRKRGIQVYQTKQNFEDIFRQEKALAR